MFNRNRARLSLVPELPKLVAYGVVGHEVSNGKAYYTPCGVFPTPLEALHFRGAARDLHNYAAYEQYFAVAIYEDGSLYELRYAYSLERCEESDWKLQPSHRSIKSDLFDCLLKTSISV